MTRSELIQELENLYPDKIIKQLSFKSPIYKELVSISNSKNITLESYLAELGFKYPNNIKRSEESIKDELLHLIPSKTYRQLKVIRGNTQLYKAIGNYANLFGMKIPEYLSSLGFEKKSNQYDEEDIKEILQTKYPNKMYSQISQNQKLYTAILKYAKSYGLTTEEYLICLGYEKDTAIDYDESEIKEALIKIYPDKKFDHIATKLNEYDYKLYNSVLDNAKVLGLKSEEYLEKLGFINNNNYHGYVVDDYDLYNIKKLTENYCIRSTKIADLLNCKRQNVSQKFDQKSDKFCKNKWIKPFSEKEIDLICDTLKSNNYYTTYLSPEFSFSIIPSKKKGNSEHCLLMRNGKTVKVSYDLPERIQNILKSQLLDLFSNEELDFFNELEQLWICEGRPIENNLKSVELDSQLKTKLDKYCNQHNTNRFDYLGLKDFIYSNRMKSITDDELRELVKLYVVEGNKVEIHTTDPHYHAFWSYAERRGQTYKEFFRSLGFEYIKKPLRKPREIVDRNHNLKLRERYLVDADTIYISSYDPYYGSLSSTASSRGLTLTEYVNTLGLSRIENLKDLPPGCSIYDYRKELASLKFLDDDRIIEALTMISNDNNEVFLIVSSYLYYLIFLKTKIENLDITAVVKRLGFTRVFDKSLFEDFDEHQQAAEELLESQTEENLVNYYLNELANIETEYKEIDVNEDVKLDRNQKLVSTLKNLYKGKCQLCGKDSNIPPICLADGTIYSEVHHIKGFHEAKSEDDIREIDSYKNTIVLCAHHHKYLHYNEGGNYQLKHDAQGRLFLENPSGDKIDIQLNYHLYLDEDDI